MRWPTEKYPLPPRRGERRVRRFAWRPTRLGEHTVWLERYEVQERYLPGCNGARGRWCEVSRTVLDLAY